MGLSNFLADKIVKRVSGAETVRISADALCELVKEHFIMGADDAFLEEVRKTAKGGGIFKNMELLSKNQRYKFFVSNIKKVTIFGIPKNVWILDQEKNVFYELEKEKHWKRFYMTVENMIKLEKINR